jgi:hypothetical protein
MVALASIVALVAFGSVGCDDDDRGNIGIGSTTTMGGVGGTTTTMGIAPTTTSMPGPTTTTMPIGSTGSTCDATVSVTSGETLGSLQYNVDYSGAQPGGFEGSADMVSCTASPSIAGSIITFNDDEPALTLRTGIISLAGFTGPTDIATCVYLSGAATDPVPSDFTITLVDAADPSFNPQTPTLALTISNCVPGCVGPECGSGMPTTTSTTTTSTTTSTTVIGVTPSQFDISFDVDDAGNYGALQYNVDYTAAPGGFNGSADMVSCTAGAAIAGSIVTFNDDEGALTLRTGIISLAGFAGPANLAVCTFDSTGATPVAGDFAITVVDASDPGLNPIAPLPSVSISSIVPTPAP